MKHRMSAEVIRVDQTMDLNGGGLTNFVVFRLEDGTECKAAVDLDTMERVLQLSAQPQEEGPLGSTQEEQMAAAQAHAAQQEARLQEELQRKIAEAHQPEPPAAPVLIEWMKLPDNIISPMMKAAMVKLGLPAEMTEQSIIEATTQIAEGFTEDDWKATLGVPPVQKAAPPAVPGLQRPPQPQVRFSDGTPIVGGGVPSRTVPKDDMGYPVVRNAGVDPGEVVGGSDTDEDGVGQF